jgi:hypothetical protein
MLLSGIHTRSHPSNELHAGRAKKSGPEGPLV